MMRRRALSLVQEALSAWARSAGGAHVEPHHDAQWLALGQLRGCTLPASSRYHGRGSEDDDAESRDAAAPGRSRGGLHGSAGGQPTLAEGAARRAMRDPLAMLMAATSVPLGISLRVDKQHGHEAAEPGPLEAEPYGSHSWQPQEPPQGQRQLRAPQLQGRRRQAPRATVPAQQAAGSGAAGGAAADCGAEPAPHGERVATAARLASDPTRALEQLEQLIASAAAAERGGPNDGGDSWGTTTQSAAEIARCIAESNRAADESESRGASSGGGGGGGGDDGDDGGDDERAEALNGGALSAEEVGRDLRELDEVFAILAQVPWLDDGDVDERELRGVVAVGLLGTLEEVGWDLRPGVAAIWRGERDASAVAGMAGGDARGAAALAAVLYHTQRLEAEYGPPAAASAELAVKAAEAGADLVALQQRGEQEAQQQRADGAAKPWRKPA